MTSKVEGVLQRRPFVLGFKLFTVNCLGLPEIFLLSEESPKKHYKMKGRECSSVRGREGVTE